MKEKLKLKLEQIKAVAGKLSKKTRIAIGIGTVVVVTAAVLIAFVLNHKDYTVLFSGISQEEATKIVGKLQESGVDYQYKDNGDILVPEDVADQTRASLAQEGYPKSGFTYDIFTENAGGMTTDSEKQTYKLYELQNRIGATIGLFDGVKDAKVTIALADEQKYALEDSDKSKTPSASVVVTMEDGGSPTAKQATAIQRLVAKSVPKMAMDNVGVFDGNGIDVSANSENSSGTSGDTGEQIAQLIETQITKKVVNVLGPFYGGENIKVSAKGKVNMEKVVREKTTYNTPEKIDENDKTGITSKESNSAENSSGGSGAGGTAGTDSNADVPQYNTQSGGGNSEYTNEASTREYLVNQIKEQGELDPGTLEDLTVSVAINSDSLGDLSQNQVKELVGNATGITAKDRNAKITVVNAPFYEEPEKKEDGGFSVMEIVGSPQFMIGVPAALGILLIVFLVLRKRRRKKGDDEELDEIIAEELAESKQKPEILGLKNDKTRELRKTVRDFADQNPEISAQMIKSLLNGGGDNGRNTDN